VDECPACQGKFLDAGELEALQASVNEHPHRAELEALDSVTEGFVAAANETLARVSCPRCAREMDRRRYGLGSQIVIDECAQGCGIWLDGGELEAPEHFYERSNEEVHIPLGFRLWAVGRGVLARLRRAKG